jgi:hypothetical protein
MPVNRREGRQGIYCGFWRMRLRIDCRVLFILNPEF